MSYNLFYGGIIRTSTYPLRYLPINIILGKSTHWKNGTIIVNNNPYFRLSPEIDNFIAIKNIKNNFALSVNDRIIYKHNNIFDYKIYVELNEKAVNKSYANFFKYY